MSPICPITPERSPHSLALPPLPVHTRARTNSDPARPRSCERGANVMPAADFDLLRSCSVPRITRNEARQHGAGLWFSRGDPVRVVSGDNGGKIGEVSRWEPMRGKWLVRLQESGGASKLYWISSEKLAPAYGYSDKTASSTPDLPPSASTPTTENPTLSITEIEGLSHEQLKRHLMTRGAQSKGLRSRLVRILKNILKEEERKVSTTPRRARKITPPAQQRPDMSNSRMQSAPLPRARVSPTTTPQASCAQLRSTPRVLTAKARRMVSASTAPTSNCPLRLSEQARQLEAHVDKMFNQSKLTLELTAGNEELPDSPGSAGNEKLEPHPDTPRHSPRLGLGEHPGAPGTRPRLSPGEFPQQPQRSKAMPYRFETVSSTSPHERDSTSPRSLLSSNLREHRQQYEPRSHFMLQRFLKQELEQRPVQARQRLVMKLKTSYNLLKQADYFSPALNAALKVMGGHAFDAGEDVPITPRQLTPQQLTPRQPPKQRLVQAPTSGESTHRRPALRPRQAVFKRPLRPRQFLFPASSTRATASPNPRPSSECTTFILSPTPILQLEGSPKDSGVSAPRSPTGLAITTRDIRSIPGELLRTPSPI